MELTITVISCRVLLIVSFRFWASFLGTESSLCRHTQGWTMCPDRRLEPMVFTLECMRERRRLPGACMGHSPLTLRWLWHGPNPKWTQSGSPAMLVSRARRKRKGKLLAFLQVRRRIIPGLPLAPWWMRCKKALEGRESSRSLGDKG